MCMCIDHYTVKNQKFWAAELCGMLYEYFRISIQMKQQKHRNQFTSHAKYLQSQCRRQKNFNMDNISDVSLLSQP